MINDAVRVADTRELASKRHFTVAAWAASPPRGFVTSSSGVCVCESVCLGSQPAAMGSGHFMHGLDHQALLCARRGGAQGLHLCSHAANA
jgi:hypothetical protein